MTTLKHDLKTSMTALFGSRTDVTVIPLPHFPLIMELSKENLKMDFNPRDITKPETPPF